MSSTHITISDYTKEIPGELVNGKTWMFPQVNSVNAHGKATHWRICVSAFVMSPAAKIPYVPESEYIPITPAMQKNEQLAADIHATIIVESGLVGGKTRKIVPTIVSVGKNLKSSNRTNTFCQALRDAYGKYNKQIKGAVQPQVDGVTLHLPMLAQVLASNITVQYPAFVQRKYNGLRAVATLDAGTCIMYSRRKTIYPGFASLKQELLPVLNKYWPDLQLYLDGELYKHNVPLQDISGKARKDQDNLDLEYMIYDCFIANKPTMIYADRKKLLDEIFSSFEFAISKPVETLQVANRGEVDAAYDRFIEEGFEGAMLRQNTAYRYSTNNYHSRDILKIKPTHDAEFVIVGWETGLKGKANGALMIKCQTADEQNPIIFPVTPAMELPDRMALAQKMQEVQPSGNTYFEEEYLGKMLIVYYDEYSVAGVPQRARTKMEIRTWD